MANEHDIMYNSMLSVSSSQPMLPTDSNYSTLETRPSAPPLPPPPYSDESQFPPPYSNESNFPGPSRMPPPYYYPPPNASQFPSSSRASPPCYYPPSSPEMSYPDLYMPTPREQPYHPQPVVYYARPPGPSNQIPQPQQQPQQRQPQQQQPLSVYSQPTGVTPVFVPRTPAISLVSAIALSCISFWVCGFLLGGIAFILAMVGQSSSVAGDRRSAIKLRNASYGFSIVGIACGLIVIGLVAGTLGSANNKAPSNPRTESCYNFNFGYYYSC